MEGYWAPTRVTWGVDNRTVAFRVIPGGPTSTRVEVRVPGADINAYLAMAASVAAGLWGLEQKLPLEIAPVIGSGYQDEKAVKLPRTLQEATDRLERSALAIIGGGLLVGFGTRLGSGCTSGHGVCGMSRGSPRSILATLTFIVAGALVVFLVRRVFGESL